MRDAGYWILDAFGLSRLSLERHVVRFLGRRGFLLWDFGCRRGCGRSSRTGARGVRGCSAVGAGSAADKFKALQNHSELAPLLAGLFVIPLVQPQPAFHEKGVPFLQILRN